MLEILVLTVLIVILTTITIILMVLTIFPWWLCFPAAMLILIIVSNLLFLKRKTEPEIYITDDLD